MFNSRRLRMIEAMLVMLFFIQAWRAVLSALFGILYDYGFEGPLSAWTFIAVGLVFLVFASPLAAPRQFVRFALLLAAFGTAIARPALNSDVLLVRYWSGLGVLACGGLYLAGLVRNRPRTVVTGLVSGLVIDQLLRAASFTYDPGLNPDFLLPFSLLALVLMIVSAVLFAAHPEELLSRLEPGQISWTGGLALGAVVFIETSLLSLPNAVARWSGFEYAVIAPVLIAITCLPLFIRVRRHVGQVVSHSRWLALGLIVIALGGLALGDRQLGLLSALGLLAAHAAVLAALPQIAESNPARQPERTGLWLMLGLWFMSALNVALGFAFAYAYTLPFMRGAGLVIYLAAGFIATQAAVTCKGSGPAARDPAEFRRPIAGLIAAGAAVLIVLIAAFPLTPHTVANSNELTAVTYTIRYGFDNQWHYRLDDIAAAIEQSGADIVTLQEVDTGRLSSYGADNVLYLARRLRMNAVYLPTVEHLTGLAILYRLPAKGYDSRLLTSIMEQTGALHAHLKVGERDLHVYSTWLGIRGEDTLKQVNEVLDFIGDNKPAILGGAFFALQDSPVYAAVNEAGFDFVALGLGAPSPALPATNPEPHTDYVWTRGLRPVRGWTPQGPAMNHAMVAVTFELP